MPVGWDLAYVLPLPEKWCPWEDPPTRWKQRARDVDLAAVDSAGGFAEKKLYLGQVATTADLSKWPYSKPNALLSQPQLSSLLSGHILPPPFLAPNAALSQNEETKATEG